MKFANPADNIEVLNIKPGEVVADLGAGSGFYSVEAGKLVGSGGKVYAVEIQKELHNHIHMRSQDAGLGNIEVIWADVEAPRGTKLADGIVDVVIISNVLFQSEDRKAFLAETYRIMKPGGRGLLIEWSENPTGLGPTSQMLVSKLMSEELLSQAGFIVDREVSVGAHHYGLIFYKK